MNKKERLQRPIVKLRKVGNSFTVTLPATVVEALHLRENDDIAVEVAGDRIILTQASDEQRSADSLVADYCQRAITNFQGFVVPVGVAR